MPNIVPTFLVADSLTDTVVAAITVIVSVLAILVSLINANGSASKQAFEQLQAVVVSLKERIKELDAEREKDRAELKEIKAELSNERRARLRYEKWARILDALLNQHHIDHPSLEAIENDEEENDN